MIKRILYIGLLSVYSGDTRSPIPALPIHTVVVRGHSRPLVSFKSTDKGTSK